MGNFITGVLSAMGGVFILVFVASYSVGGLYWLWIAIQLGSFLAFVIGIFPVTAIFTAPVGMYALIFGTPDWVVRMFG